MASELSADDLLEILRRDWAARVLDEWAHTDSGRAWEMDYSGECATYWFADPDGDEFESRSYQEADPGAARLTAALAVLPELPADVRAKLGELPRSAPSPSGQGEWVRLLAQQLRERLDDIRGASDYDHGKMFAFGAALAMLNKLAPPQAPTDGGKDD